MLLFGVVNGDVVSAVSHRRKSRVDQAVAAIADAAARKIGRQCRGIEVIDEERAVLGVAVVVLVTSQEGLM